MAQPRDRGFLLPPWYVYAPPPTQRETDSASLMLGGSLVLAFFTMTTGALQTAAAQRRHRLRSTYLYLVWTTWLTSLAMSISTWVYVEQLVSPSFWLFLAFAFLWTLQLNSVLQIVANRVSFLILRRSYVQWLKLGTLAITGLITMTGVATWLPAVLQLTPAFVDFSGKWDRATKAVFAVTDLGLNLVFLRLVWQKLISAGLTKYWALFRFNCCLTFLSVSLDVGLIGIESIADSLLYLTFSPMVFLGKLYIELSMAEMLARIVRSSNRLNTVPIVNPSMYEDQIDQATMIIGDGGGHQYRPWDPTHADEEREEGRERDVEGGRSRHAAMSCGVETSETDRNGPPIHMTM